MSARDPRWPLDLLPPAYADGAAPELPDLLRPLLGPDRASGRDVVVLLDGVGADLLAAHYALAPTLRALRSHTVRVRTVTPATTASAITSLLTGQSVLATGVLGYEVLDPAGGTVQQITGRRDIDPSRWMPLPNLAEGSGRSVVHVGPRRHGGSHLSGMAYRGWDFIGHRDGEDRIEATLEAVRRAGRDGLTYVHVPDADHVGHHHGVDSDAWRDALAQADAFLGALLRRLPRGTRVLATADHGMVDTDGEHTIDLAQHPGILRRIDQVAGEGRAFMLSTPEDPSRLAADLADLVGERALVLEQHQLLRAGVFGPIGCDISARVAGRVPDVLVLGRGRTVLEDSSRRTAGAGRMIGVHGSLTSAEAVVPLVHAEA